MLLGLFITLFLVFFLFFFLFFFFFFFFSSRRRHTRCGRDWSSDVCPSDLFFIFWIPSIWWKIIFAILLLFASGFQFITIYNHHKSLDWLELYPVSKDLRKKAVHQLIFILMIVKVFILFIMFVIATSIYDALIFGGLAVVFT